MADDRFVYIVSSACEYDEHGDILGVFALPQTAHRYVAALLDVGVRAMVETKYVEPGAKFPPEPALPSQI